MDQLIKRTDLICEADDCSRPATVVIEVRTDGRFYGRQVYCREHADEKEKELGEGRGA